MVCLRLQLLILLLSLPPVEAGAKGDEIVLHKHAGGVTLETRGAELTLTPDTARDLALGYAKAKAGGKSSLARAAVHFTRALDAHHGYTGGHSRRVMIYARAIARELGLSKGAVRIVTYSARLHDLGKLIVPREVLDGRNPKLSQEGRRLIVRHPDIGAALLEPLPAARALLPVVKAHHENVDGRGYPAGLAGKSAIPLAARIIAVADTFDAMTSERTYQRARSTPRAKQVLRRLAGERFDPRIVRAFLRVLRIDRRVRRTLQRARTAHR